MSKNARLDLGLAVLTWVGVPVVTVLAGGDLTYEGVFPLTVVLGLLLLVRRRWPLTVLLISVFCVLALRTAYLTEVGWVWPASAAYFTLAAGERRNGLRWAFGVGVFELLFAANWEWVVNQVPAEQTLARVGGEALWLALVLTAGTAYRNWTRWQGELAAGLRREQHERELDARSRAAEERLRIARELHDVVAHTLTVVGVQLRVVDEALDDSPVEARDALRTAQEVRARAVTDLHALIGVLRERADGGDPVDVAQPQVDLAGVDELVSRTRSGGLAVELEATGDPSLVPAPVALAVYRVVQEALTNAVKHSGAGRVSVRLGYAADLVTVEVIDDGAGGDGVAAPGHGVSGMRERVAALGGSLSAGPAGDTGGYAVRASIPVPSFRS